MKKLIESSKVNKKLVADLDDDVLEYALTIFVKNASKDIKEILSCFKTKNLTQLKSLAHKLAGSSIVVGLDEFSLKANKIELAENDEISLKKLKSLQKELLLIQELAK